MSVNVMVYGDREIHLRPVGTKVVIRIRAPDLETLKAWALPIYVNVELSEGRKSKLTHAASRPNFWKYYIITKTQFFREIEAGDILLFRSRSISARIMRGLANTPYDHVGILFKRRNNDTGYLIDATGNIGVAAIDLQAFFENNNHTKFEKIVLRKLHVHRTEDFYTNFVRFANR
jgi:hypothetical protein